MRTLVTTATLLGLLLLPAVADAGTVSFTASPDGTELRFSDTPVEPSAVTVSGTPTQIGFEDTSPITVDSDAGAVCTGGGTTSVTCNRSAGFDRVQVLVESAPGARDSIRSTVTGYPTEFPLPLPARASGLSLFASGSGGPATIQGGPTAEAISGPPGSDLRGGGGGDALAILSSAMSTATGGSVAGEDGDDLLLAFAPGVTIDGGAGFDIASTRPNADGAGVASTAPIRARVDPVGTTTGNGAAGQNVTLTRVDGFVGGPGDDRLDTEGAGTNLLVGLGGSDRLDGGPGEDAVFGNLGPDRVTDFYRNYGSPADALGTDSLNAIVAADGARDTIDCGAEAVATVDEIDVLTNCRAEGDGVTVVRPQEPVVREVPGPPVAVPGPPVAVPGPPVPVLVPARIDTTPPAARILTAARTVRSRALRRSGRYRIAFTASEAVRVTATLTARARRVVSIARAGDLTLARRVRNAEGGRRTVVDLTIPRDLRRLLRPGRRMAATLVLADAAGNTTTVRRAVRIRG